jgi:hypothetical protein
MKFFGFGFGPEKSIGPSASNNQDVPSTYTYQFTRHMMSCNNIGMGKIAGKDLEPSVSLYGIVKTLKLSQENAREFDSNTVFVSNLLRTWITAFLLYGSNKPELNLYISPYLKEETTTVGEEIGIKNDYVDYELKRGNYAKNITHTANKFLRFLTTLKNISDKNESIVQTNESIVQTNESTVRIDDIDDFNELLNGTITTDWYANLPSIINLYLPKDKTYTGAQNITFTKKGNDYYSISQDICKIVDTVGAIRNLTDILKTNNALDGFEENGDLKKFMEWFEETNTSNYGKPNPSLIHVVTHSQVMQKYLKDNFALDIDALAKNTEPETEPIDYSAIRNSNSWRFQTSRTATTIDIDKLKATLKPGVPLDKNYAKAIENAKITGSLCGSSGSVKDACTKNSYMSNLFAIKTAAAAGGKPKKRTTRKARKSKKLRKSRKSKH